MVVGGCSGRDCPCGNCRIILPENCQTHSRDSHHGSRVSCWSTTPTTPIVGLTVIAAIVATAEGKFKLITREYPQFYLPNVEIAVKTVKYDSRFVNSRIKSPLR